MKRCNLIRCGIFIIMSRLFQINEIAELVGVSRDTILNWRKLGTFRFDINLGFDGLIPAARVRSLLNPGIWKHYGVAYPTELEDEKIIQRIKSVTAHANVRWWAEEIATNPELKKEYDRLFKLEEEDPDSYYKEMNDNRNKSAIKSTETLAAVQRLMMQHETENLELSSSDLEIELKYKLSKEISQFSDKHEIIENASIINVLSELISSYTVAKMVSSEKFFKNSS